MESFEINKYALIGILRNRQARIARTIGIHPDTLAKRLASPDTLTLRDINAIAFACEVPLSAFISIHTNSSTGEAASSLSTPPIKLGGIWKGNTITEEEIQSARNELLLHLEGKF